MDFQRILLATDLDRTLLPNGLQEESPGARERFRSLVGHEEIILIYVSGRSEDLIRESIATFNIPLPAYAIGDVGTTIFRTGTGAWTPLRTWSDTIARDWHGKSWRDLHALVGNIDTLTLQELSKQNTSKLSYYAPPDTDRARLFPILRHRLEGEGIAASLVWSIDEMQGTGLLDVLPVSASKLSAMQFLREHLGIPERRTVFCGDSGNDLPVLTSGMQSVLVANADKEVRAEALRVLVMQDKSSCLYAARGGFLGMNGNYAAGILEGVASFFPETRTWMET